MSLSENVEALAARLADEFNALRSEVPAAADVAALAERVDDLEDRPSVLVLAAGDPIPADTPTGTVILRTP